MNFFYSQDIGPKSILLNSIETNHCIKVLRHKIGDEVNVVDGLGNTYLSKIKSFDNEGCHLEIIKKHTSKRKTKIHLCIAPTKNHKRLEWMMEKIVEIGVDRVTFMVCERSVRNTINLNRLSKVALSAMKQTQNSFLPIIDDCIFFSDIFKIISSEDLFIAHLNNKNNKLLKSTLKSTISRCIMIGPEGDFTDAEVSNAVENNFIEVSLGQTRLRTETSGIVSTTILNL